jgi:hypothetical protein
MFFEWSVHSLFLASVRYIMESFETMIERE